MLRQLRAAGSTARGHLLLARVSYHPLLRSELGSVTHARRTSFTQATLTALKRAPRHRHSSGKEPSSKKSREGGVAEERWRLFGVKVSGRDDPGKDDFSVHPALAAAVARRLGIKDISKVPLDAVLLVRKSFDARSQLRRKEWVYVVDVPGSLLRGAGAKQPREAPGQLEKLAAVDSLPSLPAPAQTAAAGHEPGASRGDGAAPAGGSPGGRQEQVVVVGSGPAGLFAALTLAEAGIKVVLLERGQPVEVRGRDIGALFVRKRLNPESNLCFGEGGAGTWSDGKLTTRIGRNSDPVRTVLNAFHQFGAPENILVAGKPHLGTDRLVKILRGFREHLASLGAEVRFGVAVDDLLVEKGRVAGVKLADGSEMRASRVVLAVGHSARDIYHRLQQHDVKLTPKPFAMGFRIEHPQSLIDQLQYGEADAEEVQRGKGMYPVADYRLSAEIKLAHLPPSRMGQLWEGGNPDAWYAPLLANPPEASNEAPGNSAGDVRGVYSFCMCPGGQIVPTSTSAEELCINGMSFSKRNSMWANSALVVTVSPSDWSHLEAQHGPLAGMALQQLVEREAARRGGGGLVAPVQRVSDFVEGRLSKGELPTSSYRLGVRSAPLHDLFPPHMTAAFRAALARFDRTMPGFAGPMGLLHAVETRTSSPLRIDRGEDLQSLSLPGLYPSGEGAGYAGGIMSSAVDGLRVGSIIAAEILGIGTSLDASQYKVSAGY